jgi:hypothetical protein
VEHSKTWAVTIIRNSNAQNQVFNAMANRNKTMSSFADAVASIAEGLYGLSIRKQILDGLLDKSLVNLIESKMSANTNEGALVVVKYVVVQTPSGPRYSNPSVFLGATAPSVQLAMSFFHQSANLFATPSVGKIGFDFLWLAPDSSSMRRVYRDILPSNACVISELQFREMN